jgi:hypothetical protein
MNGRHDHQLPGQSPPQGAGGGTDPHILLPLQQAHARQEARVRAQHRRTLRWRLYILLCIALGLPLGFYAGHTWPETSVLVSVWIMCVVGVGYVAWTAVTAVRRR